MIIDCHCHAGAGDGLTAPWNSAAPLDRYMRRAREAGIDRTVVFSAFHSAYTAANREVARIVARHPDRLWGFAFVHARRDAGRIRAMIDTAVHRYGFRGIKAHRHDAPLSREVCRVAETFRLPVLYDVMGEVASVELFATEFPRVAFIIPHLGSFSDDWRAQLALIDHLERHANVFTDTSGVRRFDLLEEALARAGAHKILFGSDGPWLHPGLELAKVRALGLSPYEAEQVTGGNLIRLLGPAPSGRRARHPRPSWSSATAPDASGGRGRSRRAFARPPAGSRRRPRPRS